MMYPLAELVLNLLERRGGILNGTAEYKRMTPRDACVLVQESRLQSCNISNSALLSVLVSESGCMRTRANNRATPSG